VDTIIMTADELAELPLKLERRRQEIRRRQDALRSAWRRGKGPQLSLAEKLVALRKIEEGVP
jgi:hypothetical protein